MSGAVQLTEAINKGNHDHVTCQGAGIFRGEGLAAAAGHKSNFHYDATRNDEAPLGAPLISIILYYIYRSY